MRLTVILIIINKQSATQKKMKRIFDKQNYYIIKIKFLIITFSSKVKIDYSKNDCTYSEN